jgi:hypothetical protein
MNYLEHYRPDLSCYSFILGLRTGLCGNFIGFVGFVPVLVLESFSLPLL